MAKVSPAEPEQGSRPRDTLAPPGARGEGAGQSPSSKASTVSRSSWRLDSKPSSSSKRAIRRPPTLISGASEGLLRIVAEPPAPGAGQRCWSWQGWYESSTAVSCRRLIRGRAFSTLAMVCLFNALFLYDAFIVFQVPSNTELDVALTLVLVVFLFELCGLALTDRAYPGGFFFWMDLIGTLSMLFDISYLLGTDATSPEQVRESSAKDNIVLVRAARTARLGARAGRLTRVLKLLRFMPCLYVPEDGEGDVKVARSITGRLNNVMAQRVAFLTICIVVMMPVFNVFQYPESDRSFTSWAKLLARSVEREVASLAANPGSAAVSDMMASELERFSSFYADLFYGPYEVCYGVPLGDGFDCQPDVLALTFSSSFEKPRRRASMLKVSASNFQACYDMSVVNAQESAANMASIVLVVAVMLGFGLLMSNSITVVVLTPLERMLSVVREHCKQIFKFAAGIQEDTVPEDDTRADDNEFQLLEDVIAKLAAIVSLSTKNGEPQVTKDMNEEDVVQLHWMQGGTAPKLSHQSHHGSAGSVASNSLRAATSTVTVASSRPSNAPSSNDADERSLNDSTTRASGARPRLGRSPTGIMECVSVDVVASLDSAHCNVLDWGKELQLGVCGYIIAHKAGCADWVCINVESQTLFKFISAVEQGYPPNPFHNFSHGVDVLYSVARFLQLIEAGRFFTEVMQYLLLVAALAHDVGHLGVNNQFLMETSHELAIKYNDRSPMEMMHCSKLFHIVRDPSCDIFNKIEKTLYKEMRKHIIDGILHTDMTHHVPMVKDLGLLYQMNSDAFDRLDPGSVVNDDSPHIVQTVMNALLHCADISNPMKPWELCHRYADMVLDEFFAQGDKEKALGMPASFLMDRDKPGASSSQVGFFELVALPLFRVLDRACPSLRPMLAGAERNCLYWKSVQGDARASTSGGQA